jgi:hypothetical protein
MCEINVFYYCPGSFKDITILFTFKLSYFPDGYTFEVILCVLFPKIVINNKNKK